MTRTCERCGAPIPPRIGPGGKRKRCPTCSPSRNRGKNSSSPVPDTVVPIPTAGESVVESTRALLNTHPGAVDHPMGRTALVLAARIDSTSESTPSITGAAKQLDSCLRIALSATEPAAPSLLDELRAKHAQHSTDPTEEFQRKRAEREAGHGNPS